MGKKLAKTLGKKWIEMGEGIGEEMVEELMKLTHKKAMGVFMELVEERKARERQERRYENKKEPSKMPQDRFVVSLWCPVTISMRAESSFKKMLLSCERC